LEKLWIDREKHLVAVDSCSKPNRLAIQFISKLTKVTSWGLTCHKSKHAVIDGAMDSNVNHVKLGHLADGVQGDLFTCKHRRHLESGVCKQLSYLTVRVFKTSYVGQGRVDTSFADRFSRICQWRWHQWSRIWGLQRGAANHSVDVNAASNPSRRGKKDGRVICPYK
jgi:hypothetical protein